jgi:hypothetical protein
MTYKEALEMGGTEWVGGDHHRVYFNQDSQKAALYGVTIKGKDGYKDGKALSRSNLFKIRVSQPFFDVKTGELAGLVKNFAHCVGYAAL